MPLVSVNIPAYNCGPYLAQALDSVLAQTITDWECIIIDDASADDTAVVAQRYVDRDPRFKLIRIKPQDKTPHPGSRIVGLAHSTGKWFAPLDGDDWWEPWKLERQLQAVSVKPGIVLCCSTGWLWQDGKILGQTHHLNPQTVGQDMLTMCMSLHTVLADRQAVTDAGGYDPAMLLAEDWDLWLRLTYRHGPAAITGLDEPCMYYRRHGNNSTQSYQRNIRFDRKAVFKTIRQQKLLWRKPLLVLRMIDAQLGRERDHLLNAKRKWPARLRTVGILLLNPLRKWRWQMARTKWG